MGRLTKADIESIKNTLEKLRTENMNAYGRISLIDDENIYEAINAVEKLAHYEDMEEQGRLIEQKYGYLMRSRDYDEDDGSYTIRQECSVCGMAFTPMFFKPAYCPSCGAKLVTKEEAEAKLKELKDD